MNSVMNATKENAIAMHAIESAALKHSAIGSESVCA